MAILTLLEFCLLTSRKPLTEFPTEVVTDKIKKVPDINPYIVNWVTDFLKDRQQRVCVDKVMTPFLPVNRGVRPGTVLGPVRFAIMVNDISPTSRNILMTKYADDITCSTPVGPNINAVPLRR